MTNIANSTRTYAAIRAQRSRLASQVETISNPVAKAAILEAIAAYDRELANAPVPVKATKAPVDRKVSAAKAWRTMLARQLKGAQGKARQELLVRIAHYDQVLQVSREPLANEQAAA